MNAIRIAMTIFILTVLTAAILGWRWSADLPSPKLEGARAALGTIVVLTAIPLILIWRESPR